jgi:hypothetical protein
MENCNLVLVIFIIIIGCYVYMYIKNETFVNYLETGPFQPLASDGLVDPLVCFPGTYWRNNSYQDICKPMTMARPMRMDVEGNAKRIPEARYEIMCNPDDKGNRNCQMVKIFDKYV